MPFTTTNMGLSTWPGGTDFFDHTQLADNFVDIDAHDHSAGKGVLVAGIAASAVAAVNLATNAVTTVKVTDLAVTTAKINDLAVTTGKLADLAVSEAKVAVRTVQTTLPASPANNREILFQSAAMLASGYGPWLLRYDSTLTTYKWRVLSALPATSQSFSSNAFNTTVYDLSTNSPAAITLPAGEYLISHGCTLSYTSAGGIANGAFANMNTAVTAPLTDASACFIGTSAVPAAGETRTATVYRPGILVNSAGTVVQRQWYRMQGTGSGTAINCWVQAIPLRLA